MQTDDIAALLKPNSDPGNLSSWHTKVHRALCLGPQNAKHMSGGACTAMMVQILEDMAQKPLIQCAVQFVKAPACAADVAITAQFVSQGRSITAAAAQIMSDGANAATMTASLGKRRDFGSFAWFAPANVDEPQQCPPIDFVRKEAGDLHSHLDMRMARKPGDGRMDFWVRAPETPQHRSAAFLALIADYLPEAIHCNIGRPAGAISLDNSLRICSAAISDWLLCSTQLEAVHDGLFHGRMHISNQSGELLATASQSGVVTLLE